MGYCSVRLCCLFIVLAALGAFYGLFALRKREIIEDYDNLRHDIFYSSLAGGIYCFLLSAATIILIVGIKMNRPSLLWPFNFVMMVGIIYCLVRVIFFICTGVTAKKPFGEIALEALPYLIIAFVHGLIRVSVLVLRCRLLEANIPDRWDLDSVYPTMF